MQQKFNDTLISAPKVSAVIFFYNDDRIINLIEVAEKQIFHFENIIIFNDGSTTNYEFRILELCRANPKITYYCSNVNKGIAHAMQSAICMVKTDYFYLMSCGDEYENYILKDFNSLNWTNIYPGIIASGINTKKEGYKKKNLYLQNVELQKLYFGNVYVNLARKHTNLFYGGGCIINTKLGVEAIKYFCELEWAADFFMYHFCGFKSGVIFTGSVSMCNLIHKNRYSDVKNTKRNEKITIAFIKASKEIDINFYNYCYNSAILPVYSLDILLKLFFSIEYKVYINRIIIYKCIMNEFGKLIKFIIPVRFKKFIRFYMGI